ncbi:50S ribosomal protein L25/general stress protein Ctc [Candidatus Bandiella euplotis]|uniref:Large ribosomal subunit protein bL25 n=1 Tax=Candidatus Bandiella euplotis TaxID=1664265 RepID=A0ABZ0UJJ9_9RICK|nr:50S ribosomal protein L25/general stress protein Ctc [Candidatus Bandiella woodruffii]WPX96280.1 50S ribosomal protein L25 [Candidatus Bandiella woodruffii]
MTELILACEEKALAGRGSSRALRRQGKIPAIIYGFDSNRMISVVYKDFLREYMKGSMLSKLFSLQIGKEVLKVIPREVQTDPVTDNPIHVDFQLVNENIPIKVSVRVKVINQDKSPGIKKGGVLNIVKRNIALNCIPRNIPRYLEIDVSGFEIGQNIHINDIKLADGVSPVEHGNFTVLTITGRVEEEKEEGKETETAAAAKPAEKKVK